MSGPRTARHITAPSTPPRSGAMGTDLADDTANIVVDSTGSHPARYPDGVAPDAPPLDTPGGIDTRLPAEVSRRRTFAIISHPDAGKTTLTEKLLLYGGAIELAGAVRGRKTAAPRRLGLDGRWSASAASRSPRRCSTSTAQLPHHPARHPGSPGLQRGHLPHALRGRQRGDGDRRRQGHRGADPQAVRGVPAAPTSDHHLRQQARPARRAIRSTCCDEIEEVLGIARRRR